MPLRSLIRRLAVFVLCALASVTALAPSSSAQDVCRAYASNPDLQRSCLGIATLQNWYNPDSGLWRTTNWWNAANALTVLVNYSAVSGDPSYQSAVENTFNRNASGKFLNYYYDDEGWWALAWIDAYDSTQNPDYLNMSATIFDDMTTGWDDVCGGGIWWRKDRTYKNAIANELFLSVAAHLANRAIDPAEQAKYLWWAQQEWQWFAQSGMVNSQKLINDGLDNNCWNNHHTTWSYNQGVILAGLVELYQQNPDWSLLQTAQDIALATIHPIDGLTDPNGILHDRCEPNCGADGVQFKGIFVRNLMALNDVFPDDRYVQFTRANAQSIWDLDQGENYQFGLIWSGPFDSANAAVQSSALDALVAAAEMSRVPVTKSIASPVCRFCPPVASGMRLRLNQ